MESTTWAGQETTINTLARKLIGITGQTSLTLTYAPAREGDIRRIVANIQKAQAELHYSPKTDLQHNLRELWDWCLRGRSIKGPL